MAQQLQIEISGELMQAVQKAVDSGEYASGSEVALEALQEWHERHDPDIDIAAVVRGLQQSIEENAPGLDPEEVFARLRARYADPQ